MKRPLVLVAALAIALLACPTGASAARAPTFLEKATIMDAFNVPGRSWSSRCVKILVSTVDERYAIVTSPTRPPRACVRNQQVGDGFELFVRPSASALRWKTVPNPCAARFATVREDVGAVCF